MTPGHSLRTLARAICSAASCERVIEPAIADLQHDYARSGSRWRRCRALMGGYAAFWQSLVACVAVDLAAPESRAFGVRASSALAVALAASAAVEALVTHTSPATREYLLTRIVYVGFAARSYTATIRFGIPLAMFPALFYAVRRTGRASRAAVLLTVLGGALLTAIASGWLAPSIEQQLMRRGTDAFIRQTGGRFYMTPDAWRFDRYPPAKTWPALLRGAMTPDPHRYAGYPAYVAPEDRGLQHQHRLMVADHLVLIALALAAGLLGWTGGVLATPER